MKITVIGIGDMGNPMTAILARTNFDVTIWDKDPSKLVSFNDTGVKKAESLSDAVHDADLVLTSVMSYDVHELFYGEGEEKGIKHFLKEDAVLIINSTIDPKEIEEIRADMPLNTQLLDSPIIGGVRYAREGKLVLIPSGPKEAFDKVEEVLNNFGTVKYVGDSGNGAKLKLITNVAIMAAEAGIREALDLADAYEMDYETIFELMKLGPLNPVINRALDETNPRPLRDSVSDDDELLKATREFIELPITEAGAERLRLAVEATDGNAEFIDITNKKTSLHN